MRKFNSKILLFGEYAILNGSKGIAIPFDKYHGRLEIPHPNSILTIKQNQSNSILKKLHNYLDNNIITLGLTLNNFKSDLQKGMYFDSNIPKGYGVGSSGALTAAIYHQYFVQVPSNMQMQLKKLASIESFFHGNSSGTDPLISYLNKAVLLQKEPKVAELNLPEDLVFFLIDTGKPRIAKEFIEIYQNKISNKQIDTETFVTLTNKVVNALIEQTSDFFKHLIVLSSFQQEFLAEMFFLPNSVKNILKEFDNEMVIKLCGAGGGGFLLGICKKEKFGLINDVFTKEKVKITPIYNPIVL